MRFVAYIPWLGLVYLAIIGFGFKLDICYNMTHLIALLVVFTIDVLQLSWERTKTMSNLNMIYSVAYAGAIMWIIARDLAEFETSTVLLFGLTIIEVVLTILLGKDLARLNVFAEGRVWPGRPQRSTGIR